MDKVITDFYNYGIGENVPMTQTISDSISKSVAETIASEDKSLTGIVINDDGTITLTVSNANGDTSEITASLSNAVYTKTESDDIYASKVGASEDFDTMLEVEDAIKDIRDVEAYDDSDIDDWFVK